MERKSETPAEPVRYTYSVPVKFEAAGKPYSFGTEDATIAKGEYVVVETQQGMELGQAEADAIEAGKYGLRMPQRPVLRRASERDLRDYQNNLKENDRAFEICRQEIEELGLQMNLLSASYTLDRSKVLFVYLADQRVDFRDLLKHLGARLHCRIELRQIGERDKARMVGGLGPCGMECCCRRFKSRFDVISINMAKNQLLALNVDKLSGMCGKLMCCLKYEDADYKEMTKGLPKMGSQVEYEGVVYRVTNMNVMANEAKLENYENVIFITLDELRTKGIPRKGVIMQRPKNDGDKPVRKTVIHNNAHHESHAPARDEKAEVRTFRRKDNREERPHGKVETRSFKPKKDANRPAPEKKNVTVRTFKRKKQEGEKA
jgi:cell fate regulator YaaT (PSP1 superfamily)